MDRPKPTKRQQEQWDKFVKDLPIYNPCPKCRKLQSDLLKLVEDMRADQYESADVNIWYSDGCKHSADRIEELLKRVSDGYRLSTDGRRTTEGDLY